ncbi:MAG: 23S rRNA (guanosine(2251)-2'-O)-methyltransferase RlmB [Gammaproteobacteria bacterium]|nr:23S rRNA (guanosine(2251)-2'-O)-methyltransferase RlmB [Gammaproteobacteria bacterium]
MSAGNRVFGFHAVGEVLRRDPAKMRELLVQRGRRDRRLDSLRAEAARHGIPLREVDRRELDPLCPGAHQGVVATLGGGAEAPALDERGLLARLVERGDRALLLVLDSITDPRNLGACLRGAAAAGADAVVVPANHSTRLNAAARKTASGAAEILPLVAVTNLARFLDRLKQAGIWIAGADAGAGAGASLFEQDLTGPIALVLGAEGKGIRRLVKEKCDHLVAIPTTGAMTSLNVAVAAGICLFEVRRQRGIA